MRNRLSIAVLSLAAIVLVIQAVPASGEPIRSSTGQGSAVLVPEGKSKTKRPALILLPFTGGSAHDLYERWYSDSLAHQAQRRGFIVVLPTRRGSTQDYSTGSAWTETLNRYRRDVAADAKELVSRFDADPNRIALAGYSMGGDLGWALIQRDPELYSGAVVMGSRASYRDKGLDRFARRGGRIFFFMGTSESEARKSGARAAEQAVKRAGIPHRYVTAGGDHIPAPAGIFEEAVEFVLGYSEGVTSPAAGTSTPIASAPDAPPTWATQARITSKPIIERLPLCSWVPFEDEKTEQFGFKDANGKIRVPARYTHAWEFGPDGLAPLHKGSQWGYMTCEGKEFFVMVLDYSPDPFSNGLSRFRESGRTGFVNRRGDVVFPAQFEDAGPFCGGMARVGRNCRSEQRGEYTLVDCQEHYYINTSGKTVPTPTNPPEPPDCDPPSMSSAPVKPSGKLAACNWQPFRESSSGLFGYRDATGKTTIKPRFEEAKEFGPDGVAQARDEGYGVGYVTCEGKFFYVFYDGGWDTFRDGLVRIEGGGDYRIGYADYRGNTIIKPRYSFGSAFCGGVALVGNSCSMERNSDKKLIDVECDDWKYIDRAGKEVAEETIKEACEDALTSPGYDEDEDESDSE